MKEKNQKKHLMGLKMTEKEHAQLKQAAKDHSLTMGEYVRYLVRKDEYERVLLTSIQTAENADKFLKVTLHNYTAVVRCKDCIHYDEKRRFCTNFSGLCEPKPTDYCSLGIRKVGE